MRVVPACPYPHISDERHRQFGRAGHEFWEFLLYRFNLFGWCFDNQFVMDLQQKLRLQFFCPQPCIHSDHCTLDDVGSGTLQGRGAVMSGTQRRRPKAVST